MTKQDSSESIHRLGGVPFLRAASRKPAAVAMARSMLSTEMKPNSCTLSIDITTAVHEATCATTACEHVSLPSTAQHPAAPNHLRHHAHDPLHVRWCVEHWLATVLRFRRSGDVAPAEAGFVMFRCQAGWPRCSQHPRPCDGVWHRAATQTTCRLPVILGGSATSSAVHSMKYRHAIQ